MGSRPAEVAQETAMSNDNSLPLDELEDRIRILRDNIRQLIEQAAALSGAEDEERSSDRIAQQNDELERMIRRRDELMKRERGAP
jgi:dynactin complex subunit